MQMIGFWSLGILLGAMMAQAQPAAVVAPELAEGEVMAERVPPEVMSSAVAAVAKLGEEVVLGHYQVAVERMNPIWKARMAKGGGGMESPEKQAAAVAAQMLQKGISMISCQPQGTPLGYEVAPGTQVSEKDGVETRKLVYTKWLVLVPTLTKFRVMLGGDGQPPKVVTIDSISFQVAISDKGRNNWTFIDGSELKVSDLRGLFGTLPQDMKLPRVERRQASQG